MKILPSLFLAAIGILCLWIGFHVFGGILKTVSARSWVPVDAKVLSWSYETQKGVRIGTRPEGAIPYITAEYAYSFGGKTYQSHQVGIERFIGLQSESSWNGRSEKLRDSDAHEGKITVFVNPAHPEESLIDRHLPTKQILALSVFCMIFCGLFMSALYGHMLTAVDGIFKTNTSRFQMPVTGIIHGSPCIPVYFLSTAGDYDAGSYIMIFILASAFFAGITRIVYCCVAKKA